MTNAEVDLDGAVAGGGDAALALLDRVVRAARYRVLVSAFRFRGVGLRVITC